MILYEIGMVISCDYECCDTVTCEDGRNMASDNGSGRRTVERQLSDACCLRN